MGAAHKFGELLTVHEDAGQNFLNHGAVNKFRAVAFLYPLEISDKKPEAISENTLIFGGHIRSGYNLTRSSFLWSLRFQFDKL